MNNVTSLFSQLLHHFPRTEFAALVKKHNAEYGSKGFKCWTQFVAMLFCQLAKADSLREICNGLSCCLGKLVHLGIKNSPNKSPCLMQIKIDLLLYLKISSGQHFNVSDKKIPSMPATKLQKNVHII